MRVATDGIASTNPIPLAIPILCERALPPDRLSGKESTSSSPSRTKFAANDRSTANSDSVVLKVTSDDADNDGLPSS